MTKTIKKSDLVNHLHENMGLNKVESKEIVEAFFEEIKNSLVNNEEVKISGFGNFKILNKNDLPAKIETIPELKSVNEFPFSAINCSDEILIEEIEKILTKINTSSEGGSILSSARQITAVEKTLISLKNAKPVLQSGELELFSFYINEAIEHISSISRQYTFNEMLDSMFSNFCLGK